MKVLWYNYDRFPVIFLTNKETRGTKNKTTPYPVEQNGSDSRQAIHYVVYRLPAVAAILFYWIKMKVVQQLICLSNIGRPNGPAYSTSELLNTPLLLPANVMIYDLI